MRPRSELMRAIAALTLIACLGGAHAQDTVTEGAALEAAIEEQVLGRPWQAQSLLRPLAEAGQVAAMERLALLHWYGPRLYPGEAWSRTLATQWFERAAERGSELSRHMLKVAQATAGTVQSAAP